jgi:hypothetical protein
MPATKQTIAIIGSDSTFGRAIARGLCVKNFRLLLFDENRERARALSEEIGLSVEDSDVHFPGCEHLASWEADIIIIARLYEPLKKFSDKTKVVSIQKILALLLDSDSAENLVDAESLFPHSKVVAVFPDKNFRGHAELRSRHPEALAEIRELLASAGFQADSPPERNSLSNITQ